MILKGWKPTLSLLHPPPSLHTPHTLLCNQYTTPKHTVVTPVYTSHANPDESSMPHTTMKPINLTHTHKPWWMLYIITSKQTLIKPLYIFPTQTLLKPVHLLHTDPTETSTPPTHRPCWNQYTSYTQTLLKPVHLPHADSAETSTPPTHKPCWNQYTSYTQTLLKPDCYYTSHTQTLGGKLWLDQYNFPYTDPGETSTPQLHTDHRCW